MTYFDTRKGPPIRTLSNHSLNQTKKWNTCHRKQESVAFGKSPSILYEELHVSHIRGISHHMPYNFILLIVLSGLEIWFNKCYHMLPLIRTRRIVLSNVLKCLPLWCNLCSLNICFSSEISDVVVIMENSRRCTTKVVPIGPKVSR